MTDKEKIIIIAYVGVADIDRASVPEYLYEITNAINNTFDDTIKILTVPDYENTGIKIECVNPVLVNEEKYKEVDALVDKVKENLEDILKEE